VGPRHLRRVTEEERGDGIAAGARAVVGQLRVEREVADRRRALEHGELAGDVAGSHPEIVLAENLGDDGVGLRRVVDLDQRDEGRIASKAEPGSALVPDLVMMFTTPPAVRPASAV
jgi:hypothetical protein